MLRSRHHAVVEIDRHRSLARPQDPAAARAIDERLTLHLRLACHTVCIVLPLSEYDHGTHDGDAHAELAAWWGVHCGHCRIIQRQLVRSIEVVTFQGEIGNGVTMHDGASRSTGSLCAVHLVRVEVDYAAFLGDAGAAGEVAGCVADDGARITSAHVGNEVGPGELVALVVLADRCGRDVGLDCIAVADVIHPRLSAEDVRP